MDTYDPLCQACREEPETTIHMFQCTNEDYVNWRTSFFKQLASIIQHQNLSEDMKDVFTEGIQMGFKGEKLDPVDYALEMHFSFNPRMI